MNEWESYANSIEKQTIAKLQKQVNDLMNENYKLSNINNELQKQLENRSGTFRQSLIISSNLIPEWLGKTMEERFAKFLEIYNMTGIALQE